MDTILEIEPFITARENGLDWIYYLTIRGGQGHGKNNGGKYRFIIAYLSPDQSSEAAQMSLDIYCQSMNIVFGAGDTIEQAYATYQQQSS